MTLFDLVNKFWSKKENRPVLMRFIGHYDDYSLADDNSIEPIKEFLLDAMKKRNFEDYELVFIEERNPDGGLLCYHRYSLKTESWMTSK